MLSTCSEYFSEIFDRTPCKSPVVVLKDVRWQDLEALLDYMYLGEVNVNQNDLASLLKTAECLRIKGLAVPDEDVSKNTNKAQTNVESQKHPSDNSVHSPPSKKRRRESSQPSSSSPRPKSSTSTTNNQNDSFDSANISSSTRQNLTHDSSIETTPLVKIEMEDQDDQDQNYVQDGFDNDQKENENTVSKSEVASPSYSGGNFSAPQHMVRYQFIDTLFLISREINSLCISELFFSNWGAAGQTDITTKTVE